MADTLLQLVAQARLDDTCSHGHDWQTDSGRGCDAKGERCQGSQPAYRCARCGEWDYGDPGGPGYDDCMAHCGAPAHSPQLLDQKEKL